ncbi:neuroserpin-like [Uranotaenia lowii]|uniref:neuroserpin-like n=1 Tax=Uranotaenia lowii TaxID=190385 RepID=UPI00247ADC76|nr:neuroserpin-like [Uranotaenia lowii]
MIVSGTIVIVKMVRIFLAVLASFFSVHGIPKNAKYTFKPEERFTFDCFKQAYSLAPELNSVLSPVSMRQALSMILPAANREASESMRQVLGLSSSLHDDSSQPQSSILNGSENGTLTLVSQLFYDESVEIRRPILESMKLTHNVIPEAINFQHRNQVANLVNIWAKNATNGAIQKVIDPTEIGTQDGLLLLNAIFMNATWADEFESRFTVRRTFHFVNGKSRMDLMFNEGYYRYGLFRRTRVIEIPYRDDLSMVVIVPKKGLPLSHVIDKLSDQYYYKLEKRLSLEYVELWLPKFSIDGNVDGNAVLQALGLNAIFQEGAFDFSPKLTPVLETVKQCARIDVTEKGTIAAAVTAMKMSFRMEPPSAILFTINRPFIYIIRKTSTRQIIFIGHFSHQQSIEK